MIKNNCNVIYNLAKLEDCLDESPTVMVGKQQNKTKNLGKNSGILKPSWAFVETNKPKYVR